MTPAQRFSIFHGNERARSGIRPKAAMTTENSLHNRRLFTLIAIAVMAIPLLLYGVLIERIPAVDPGLLLDSSNISRTLLVDIRSPEAFAALHLRGAVSWPMDELSTASKQGELPKAFRGKQLIVYCDSGLLSARAVSMLRRRAAAAYSLRGGLAAVNQAGKAPLSRQDMERLYEGSAPLPYQATSLFDQYALVYTDLYVRPTYILLSFLLILILWRRREQDLTALRWSMIAFLFGETARTFNSFFRTDNPLLPGNLHCYGMVLAFTFFVYALLEGLDTRVVSFSDSAKPCAAVKICPACYKNGNAPCGLKRLFLLLIPLSIVIAFMPLCAPLKAISYNTDILGAICNLSHDLAYLVYEIRYCPIAAMTLFTVAFLVLAFKKESPVALSKVWFSFGAGALAFGMMRWVLLGVYQDRMTWFTAWEEITELIFILATGITLWLFRARLLAHDQAA